MNTCKVLGKRILWINQRRKHTPQDGWYTSIESIQLEGGIFLHPVLNQDGKVGDITLNFRVTGLERSENAKKNGVKIR